MSLIKGKWYKYLYNKDTTYYIQFDEVNSISSIAVLQYVNEGCLSSASKGFTDPRDGVFTDITFEEVCKLFPKLTIKNLGQEVNNNYSIY